MINSVLYLSRFIGMVEGIGFHGIKTVRESNNKLKDQASKVSAEWENLFFFFSLFSFKQTVIQICLCTFGQGPVYHLSNPESQSHSTLA